SRHVSRGMLDILLVNWNSGQQLAEVISSIKKYHLGLVASVIVVDNASTDNSLELFIAQSDNLPFEFHVIRNTENRGFGVACNLGATLARSEYLLFLNPDTRLFENSLSVPLTFMQQQKNSEVGICGIQLIDTTRQVSRTCSRFPSIGRYVAQALGLSKLSSLQALGHNMAEWDHGDSREVDQIIGAFFFVRVALFRELKGFDERYFVYFEEVDFSYRAYKMGYRSIFLAGAQAFHAGGGTSQQVKAERLFYSLRSRLLYGFKHFSCVRALLLLAVTMLIEPVSRLVFSFLRGGIDDVRNTLTAYTMLWRALPAILKRELHKA
ncbi:MAG: glycosyltransferase family 2 protein, partial [Syntrophobacter sp.]